MTITDTEAIFAASQRWLSDAAHQDWLLQLEAMEAELPPTRCAHRGACCDSSLWSALEYHRAMAYLDTALQGDSRRAVVEQLLQYEPRRRDRQDGHLAWRCAFRDDTQSRCEIYPVRGLVCRAYGLLPGTCPLVEVTADASLTRERFAELVAQLEGMTEVIPAEPPIPLMLPVEIWVRVARDGLREAMRCYLDSPFYTQLMDLAQNPSPEPDGG